MTARRRPTGSCLPEVLAIVVYSFVKGSFINRSTRRWIVWHITATYANELAILLLDFQRRSVERAGDGFIGRGFSQEFFIHSSSLHLEAFLPCRNFQMLHDSRRQLFEFLVHFITDQGPAAAVDRGLSYAAGSAADVFGAFGLVGQLVARR